MAIPQKVKNVLVKIFQIFKEDPEKLTNLPVFYGGKKDERAYTVENLENLACNHLFDDHPTAFRITELEGYIIRHYFCVGAETYDFVKDLRKEFPDFFKQLESQEYLEEIVNYRRKKPWIKSYCFIKIKSFSL